MVYLNTTYNFMRLSKTLFTILFTSGISLVFAEENPLDSLKTYNLEELNVEAPKIIRKADMDVYHPSQSAIENSANGLQLISMLSIPTLYVDEIMNTVKSAGENVQIRINGRKASPEQVRNLSPDSIKRIEWIDNPGLRYDDAPCVLNIIVVNPSAGGSLYLMAQPVFNVLFGNYNADVKLNQGYSQWNFTGYFKPCESSKVHRQYSETFTYPDGEKITRLETPDGGKIKNYQGWGNLGYSYIKPDTTIFNARLSAWSEIDNFSRFNGILSINGRDDHINLLNETAHKGVTPSLSLYLEQHFSRRQTFVVDFSASLYTGFSSSLYRESMPDDISPKYDINTHIKDFNQAYALEADYIKEWGNSKLTTGLNYSANRNRSKYRYLDNAIFHQRQDKFYFFAEYFQRLGKFSFSAGAGARYTDFLFRETGQGSNSWNFRPQATVTFAPNPSNQFRLNFTSWQITPSLEETNIVPQQTDGFQWNVGNPDLKTYNNYQLSLRYGFSFPVISGNFNIKATTSPKAVAPYLYWDNDRLITTYENSIGKQSLSFSFSPQIEVIPAWLTISGSVEYLIQRTQGNGYKLYNRDWNGNVQAILSHWNFTFIVQYQKARRQLWGQKLSWGEDDSAVLLAYNWKKWQFGAFMFMPFGEYDQGSKMLSEWNTNEYHLRLDFRMVGVMVTYNLQWGRQKRGINKLIDSDANVDKSSAKSR